MTEKYQGNILESNVDRQKIKNLQLAEINIMYTFKFNYNKPAPG